MIIQEMEAEVAAHETRRREHMESALLEGRREELEDQLRFHQAALARTSPARSAEEQQKRNGATNGGGAPLLAEANGEHVQIDYATSFYEAERGRTSARSSASRGQLPGRRRGGRQAGARDRPPLPPLPGPRCSRRRTRRPASAIRSRYACIYTSRVPNLLAYSPCSFRSPRPDAARVLIAEASAPVRGRRMRRSP